MDKKKQKNGSSNIVLAGIFSCLLGLILSIAYMIRTPVELVQKYPDSKKAVPGTLYYLKGNESGSLAWIDKQRAFLAGKQNVSVQESELNAWSKANFLTAMQSPATPPAPENQKKDFLKDLDLSFTLGPPQFRFVTEDLQIAIPITIKFFGNELKTYITTLGSFDKNGDNILVFKAKTTSFGGARFIPPFYNTLLYGIIDKVKDSKSFAPITESWSKLKEVKIEKGLLWLNR